MLNKIILLILSAALFCFPTGPSAAGAAEGQPFNNLQQQIDRLNRRLGDLADRFSPPTISYALSCSDAFSLTVELSITDDGEIAYYAIQEQGGNPPANIITFVEPGLAYVNCPFTVETGPGIRTFLLLASDIYGNVSKSLLQIQPDICLGPCPDGAICP